MARLASSDTGGMSLLRGFVHYGQRKAGGLWKATDCSGGLGALKGFRIRLAGARERYAARGVSLFVAHLLGG